MKDLDVELMKDCTDVLKALSQGAEQGVELLKILDAELSLPNIPLPTMDKEVFWDNLAEYKGWKLQQNMITRHARIIDSNNIRIAWGTINGMMKVMDRMVACLHKYDEPKMSSEERVALMQELKQLKELLDIGAITEDEYNSKKKEIMKNI